MKTIHYNIHGLLSVRICGLSKWVLKDLNTKLWFFERPCNAEIPDINVVLGKFSPDLRDCHGVDQSYFVKPGYLYFFDEDKGLKWHCEIRGFPSARLEIRFWLDPASRLKFPWTFFPDLVFHHYVLWPILERKFLEKGILLLHAAAAERNGRAIVLSGRGETYKTSIMMEYLKRGYRVLGDDFILVRGNEVLSFPTSPAFFKFTCDHLKDEHLRGWDYFRLGFALSKKTSGLNCPEKGIMERLILLVSRSGNASLNEASREDHLDRIYSNMMLEKCAYVSYKYKIGRFLDAYETLHPVLPPEDYDTRCRNCIRDSFKNLPIQVQMIPRHPAEHFFRSFVPASKESL